MNSMVEHYQGEFQRLIQSAALLDVGQRQTAWQSFAQVGFPGAKTEAWRYTRLSALEKLALSCSGDAGRLSWSQLEPHCHLPQAPRLVLVDGLFSPELSSLQGLPPGVHLEPATRGASAVGKPLNWDGNVLSGFTAAFAREGFCLRVEPQVRCSEPLLVMQVSFGSNQASACLNRIELGLGSQAVFLEQCISLTQEPCWSNQWLHVGLAQQAQLTHVRWLKGGPQTWQWSRLCIEQQQGSQYHGHSFAVAGRLGRQEVEVNLSEAGAAAHVAGAWWATGQEHQDVHTLVRHQAPGCESSQTFKGVLDGRARAVFDGRIVVAEQAQKTVARQANHNLLLSGDAEVDTKPQLEILADDVKCSHGTTVGQLNQDQLFYLLARGVGLEAARAMLIEAFVQEIAQDINHSKLREVMTQRLHEVLHG